MCIRDSFRMSQKSIWTAFQRIQCYSFFTIIFCISKNLSVAYTHLTLFDNSRRQSCASRMQDVDKRQLRPPSRRQESWHLDQCPICFADNGHIISMLHRAQQWLSLIHILGAVIGVFVANPACNLDAFTAFAIPDANGNPQYLFPILFEMCIRDRWIWAYFW